MSDLGASERTRLGLCFFHVRDLGSSPSGALRFAVYTSNDMLMAAFTIAIEAENYARWKNTGVFPTEKPPRYRVRKHADEWLVDDHEYPTAVTAVRSVGHMVAFFIREGAEERARAWAEAENAKVKV